jgi:transposase
LVHVRGCLAELLPVGRFEAELAGAFGEGAQDELRSSCVPTAASLSAVEQAALAGAVVFEPTGAAWMPIAVFFARRGHAVYRVSSAKAADLRRFLRRHAKTNGIDAETLARMPRADPQGLQQLELPGPGGGPALRVVRGVKAAYIADS